MMLIHQNSFISATYDTSTQTVLAEYIGLIKVEAITEVLTKVKQFSDKQPVRHMIVNLSKTTGTFTTATDFMVNEYYPTMIKNGLKTSAVVVSSDVFTKFSVDKVKKRLDNMDVQTFSSIADAEKWTASKRV